MKAPVEYIADFVPDPDAVFAALKELSYERRDTTPRSEFFCSDHPFPYAYGRGRGVRTYIPNPWPPVLLPIRAALEKHTGQVLDVCFVNRYHDQSDHLGWHSDDSPEMDDERSIISVSLGVAREIWFRPIGARGVENIQKLLLEHGSVCIMHPHMQEGWEHRIPKASFLCGERISLVFRGYVVPPNREGAS